MASTRQCLLNQFADLSVCANQNKFHKYPSSAIADPIPRAAPVTSETFPSRLFIFFSSNWLRHISTHKPPTQSLSRFVSIATSSGSPDPRARTDTPCNEDKSWVASFREVSPRPIAGNVSSIHPPSSVKSADAFFARAPPSLCT